LLSSRVPFIVQRVTIVVFEVPFVVQIGEILKKIIDRVPFVVRNQAARVP